MIHIAVSRAAIDAGAELARIERPGAGATATFSGYVRADDAVTELLLEHYPGMTEHALATLAGDALARWGLTAVSIVHRVGVMRVGEQIVFVGTAAAHRRPALDACAALIDRLKTDAPFWKRETRANGDRWVERRAEDEAAARCWD